MWGNHGLLIFVADRCTHHSRSSGYDRLADLFPKSGCASLMACEKGHLAWRRIPACFLTPPRTVDELVRRFPGQIVWHILYGDFTPLPLWIRAAAPRSTIIVTLHQPVWLLRERSRTLDSLNEADVVVALSRHHAHELRQLRLVPPVVHIYHGIWPEPFRPTGARSESGAVLVVGEHLRDWSFLLQVSSVLTSSLGIRCHLVVPQRYHYLFVDMPNVRLDSGITEQELTACYHRAMLVLLPLVDSTANNTVLEAMASGCPVVCNRLPSLYEYLGCAGAFFPTGDIENCLRLILRLHRDCALRRAKRNAVLDRADRFSWRTIQPQYQDLYSSRSQ